MIDDLLKLSKSIHHLKHLINKYNRDSNSSKIELKIFEFSGNMTFRILNFSDEDQTNLKKFRRQIEVKYIPYTLHYYEENIVNNIDIEIEGLNTVSVSELINLFNVLYENLVKPYITKDNFIRHCELASEIVSEWPEYKQNILSQK